MDGSDRRRGERLRVGLVIGQLTYGGAESQLYELARGLVGRATDTESGRDDACNVVVYCLSSKDEPYGGRLRQAGVAVRTLEARGSFDVGRVLALARALREDRIDVVHAFLFLASAYAYLATRLTAGIALVTSARNCKPEPHPLRRLVMRRAFAASRLVICNSSEMQRYAEVNYGAPSARTRVVYNGVDTGRFARPRVEHRGLHIGTVGRIEKQKNLDVFLAAAEGFLRVHPGTRFSVVGDGSLRGHYTEEVRRRGLGANVELPGTTAEVPALLAGLDQFWLTSDYEGTPNVVLEAMAAGVPVVATRVGGTGEVIEDGRSGSLVEAGDAQAVVRAALDLAADRSRADSIGARAREAVRSRFSLAAMVDATREVYAEARGACAVPAEGVSQSFDDGDGGARRAGREATR